jgi:hypothetical protein
MAVGSVTTRAHVTRGLAQIWNRRSWQVLKSPPGTGLTTVTRTLAELWNGTRWKILATPAIT